MNLIDGRNLVAALLSLVTAGVCLSYVLTKQRRKNKKPIYLISASFFTYLGVVYLLAYIFDLYLIRSGWLGIFGLVLLMFAFIFNIVADWRKDV